MAVVPIGTYFGTLSHLFNGTLMVHLSIVLSAMRGDPRNELPLTHLGNTTHSAISAVLAANVVLVGYVVVAFREEVASSTAQGQTIGLEKRKDR
jgi:hypothetical protein